MNVTTPTSCRSLRKCPQAVLGEEEQRLPNIETNGAIEFKMDKKSYRMIPLANSEDYLYHRHSLERARQVSYSSVRVLFYCLKKNYLRFLAISALTLA